MLQLCGKTFDSRTFRLLTPLLLLVGAGGAGTGA